MENKWAIILGCSTGHGAATARQLASEGYGIIGFHLCLLYTSPSPRDVEESRMPSSA